MKRLLLWLIGLFVFFLVIVVVGWFFTSRDDYFAKPNRVGVVEVEGTILDAREYLETLHEYSLDPNVKAVIVRVESAGGGVAPSQEIYREIRKVSKTKPVIASLGSVAASGGYYVACGATRVMTNPGTLTGSIGVIVPLPHYGELLEKIGYHTTVIKSARFKDIGNPERSMTDAEREIMQETVDAVHEQFVQAISEGRNMPVEEVRKIADGRIITGERALELNLVDAFGNFEDAVRLAAELGEIKGEPEVVFPEEDRFGVLSLLLGKGPFLRLERVLGRLDELLGSAPHPVRYQAPLD